MSTGPKITLEEAHVRALELQLVCKLASKVWTVAGSVRRRRELVGDIEHVVIAEFGDRVPAGEMFPRRVNLVLDKLDDAERRGVLVKQVKTDGSTRWGEKYRALVCNGQVHEVFLADEKNYGAILAIRTGPAELSRLLVTRLRDGGRFRQEDGYVKYASGPSAGSVLAAPTEEAFFKLCGVEWVPPEERDALAEKLGSEHKNGA